MDPDADSLQVTHFHYTGWPDHGVPQFATSLLSFMRRTQKAHDKGQRGPLLVHCTAGGTFIAWDTLLDMMRSEKTISVFEVVKDMRRQGPNTGTMLQFFPSHLDIAFIPPHLSISPSPPSPPFLNSGPICVHL